MDDVAEATLIDMDAFTQEVEDILATPPEDFGGPTNFDPAPSTLQMPSDLWSGLDVDDPGIVWKTLEQDQENAISKRVDLVGLVAKRLEASGDATDRYGFLNRLLGEFRLESGDEGQDKTNYHTVRESWLAFKLFRSALGWRRSELSRYGYNRLRSFFRHEDWARRHPGAVRELLEATVEGHNGLPRLLAPNELRLRIDEAVRAERQEAFADGQTPPDAPTAYVTLTVAIPEPELQYFHTILDSIVYKHALDGAKFSNKQSVWRGEALRIALHEWVNGEFLVDRPDGGEELVTNRDFLPGARFHPLEDGHETREP